jgi:hypothetical protein
MRIPMSEVNRILAAMDREFLRPTWYQAECYRVETTEGTQTVPCDVVGALPVDADGNVSEKGVLFLLAYCAGETISATRVKGWLAYLSAPGYLDRTDYALLGSEEEAKRYLVEMYGVYGPSYCECDQCSDEGEG